MSNDREIDTMNTSFIDLICCALGSMLMLMLFVACLVRATVSHASGSASNGSGGQEVGVDEGYEASPPEPLIASLEWRGLAKYPLQLVAYPPGFSNGKLDKQDKVQLTAANGLARLEGGDTYFGFFDRKSGGGDRWQLQLIVPRGRSAAADAHFRADANNKGEKLTGSKAPSHTRYWQFEVVYPNESEKNGPAEALAKAFENAPNLQLMVTSGVTAWRGDGEVKPPSPTSAPKPFKLMKELRTAEKPPKDIQDLLAGKPSLTLAKSDGQVVSVRADWVAGFGPPGGARDVEFGKLWRTAILPELILAAAHPPQKPSEQHQVALRIADAVDKALKKANERLSEGRNDTLAWGDVVAGAAEEAVPGSGTLLGRVREYVSLYAGTDPEKGGTITVRLKVEAYFAKESRNWVTAKGSAPTASLQEGGKVVFLIPNP